MGPITLVTQIMMSTGVAVVVVMQVVVVAPVVAVMGFVLVRRSLSVAAAVVSGSSQ